jgi:predicted nucleotidyltransferase
MSSGYDHSAASACRDPAQDGPLYTLASNFEPTRNGMSEHIEDLQEVLGETVDRILRIQALDADDDDTVIYVSGSLIEGHGHETSDVDVFVVGDRRPTAGLQVDIDNYQVAVDFGENRRIDYEYWPLAQVEQLAQKLTTLDLGRDFVGMLRDEEEVFIHRLRVGVPISGSAKFERVQGLFDFTRLRRYQTIKAFREIDNVLDDLTGMIESEHLSVALMRSADLVGYVVDAWTHHCGNTNPYQKWRLRILEDLPSTDRTREVLEGFWRQRFPDAAVLRRDPRACRAHIIECMEFANSVTDWIQS